VQAPDSFLKAIDRNRSSRENKLGQSPISHQ
jgi:hypothetical protein